MFNDLCTNNVNNSASCGELLIECNTVIKRSYSLQCSWLESICWHIQTLSLENVTLIGRGNKEVSGKLVMLCFLFWMLVTQECSAYKN